MSPPLPIDSRICLIFRYSTELNALGDLATEVNGMILVWLQPTLIVDGKLPSDEKRQFMTETVVATYRSTFTATKAATAFAAKGSVIDTAVVSATRQGGSVDGVHYSEEVYKVIAQMTSNAYAMRFPAFHSKKTTLKQMPPKPTGSMSFPSYGAVVLALSFVMIFSMDSFLGFGFISLKLFGRSYDWEGMNDDIIHFCVRKERIGFTFCEIASHIIFFAIVIAASFQELTAQC